jgi:hypothetical protein
MADIWDCKLETESVPDLSLTFILP